jgi:ankyrin repeat protein
VRHNVNEKMILYYLVRQGNYSLVSELLARGAEHDVADLYGRTSLYYAIANRNAEIVSVLLFFGANVLGDELDLILQSLGEEPIDASIRAMVSNAKDQQLLSEKNKGSFDDRLRIFATISQTLPQDKVTSTLHRLLGMSSIQALCINKWAIITKYREREGVDSIEKLLKEYRLLGVNVGAFDDLAFYKVCRLSAAKERLSAEFARAWGYARQLYSWLSEDPSRHLQSLDKLSEAISNNTKAAIVKLAINNGKLFVLNQLELDMDVLSCRDESGKTALMYAAEAGVLAHCGKQLGIADRVIRELRDNKGMMAIHYAAGRCNNSNLDEIAGFTQYVYTFVDNKGNNILHCAAAAGNAEFCSYIIGKFKELATQNNDEGAKPYECARDDELKATILAASNVVQVLGVSVRVVAPLPHAAAMSIGRGR